MAVTVFQTHSHQAVFLVPVASVAGRPPLGAILSRPDQDIPIPGPLPPNVQVIFPNTGAQATQHSRAATVLSP